MAADGLTNRDAAGAADWEAKCRQLTEWLADEEERALVLRLLALTIDSSS